MWDVLPHDGPDGRLRRKHNFRAGGMRHENEKIGVEVHFVAWRVRGGGVYTGVGWRRGVEVRGWARHVRMDDGSVVIWCHFAYLVRLWVGGGL